MSEEHTHFAKWISLGDLLVLCASLVGIAMSYGKLSADLQSVTREVHELQNRDITPGAREIAAQLDARVNANEEAISVLRSELREQRSDMVSRLDRIETALNNHDRK